MDQAVATAFRLGDWTVDPLAQRLTRGAQSIKLEPRTLRLLLCLAARQGQVVAADTLLDEVWPGVIVTPDSVYQAVAALRRLLGDDTRDPRYIVTVPKQGYRMIAPVAPLQAATDPAPVDSAPVATAALPAAAPDRPGGIAAWFADAPTSWFPRHSPRQWAFAAAVHVLAVVSIAQYAIHRPAPPAAPAAPAATSVAPAKAGPAVAVLPFLDLTESMGEEVFADGMTEALIDQFSQTPGLRVPAPTDAFWLKDKDLSVAQIAARLGVEFVVDGSVRKSGDTLHVAARLVRAKDGFVLWSASYERGTGDRLMVQEDVAAAVKAAVMPLLRSADSAAR